jgi:crotonobetainyl-CoA:carnitine CoA-transferase CaiB-like acyl-CoA transferase
MGLEGLRVVELGQMVGVPYTAKLLADLGADVIKIEPPEGDRSRRRGPFSDSPDRSSDQERSGLFTYLNTNKRSVVVDLATPAGRADLEALISEADLVVHDLDLGAAQELGLDPETVRRTFPGLVVTALTAFGQTGPYANFRAEEITVAHAGGWAYLTPGCSDRDDLPPLKVAGHQTDFQSAFAAAAAAVAAVDRADRTGHGEHIDFSKMAYTASMLEAGFIFWSYLGEIAGRLGSRVLNPWKILPAEDGLIFIVCVEEDQWERLKELMGHPEWADLEIFQDLPSRHDNEDLLHMYLGEWTSQAPVMELFHRGQAARVAFAPVFTMEQMSQDPHLKARGFLRTFEQPGLGELTVPGPPARYEIPIWDIRTPAPKLGSHAGATFTARRRVRPTPDRVAAKKLPLEGVRIADFSWVWAGPFCGMHLAHLGAEVVKVESRSRPDLGRRLPTHAVGIDPTPDTNGYFNQWHQGKRSISVDLSTQEGRVLAKRIALESDAVISNYATGVMERFGLSYPDLVKERSDVIVATISGFGNVGPYGEYIGYGPTTGPLSGLCSLTGYEGLGPEEVGVALGDPAAGISTAFAVVAALYARRTSGHGQWIDSTLWEATTVGLGEAWMEFLLTGDQPPRRGNRDSLMAPHNAYRCAGDDDWVSIACASDAEWRTLANLIGAGLAADDRFASEVARKMHEDELDAEISRWCAGLDRWEVTRQLQAVGVAAMPSLHAADLDVDPHLNQRGLIERLPHPAVGERAHVGIPWLLTDGPNGVRRPAPMLGQHTDEILQEMFGFEDAEISRLRELDVLR